MEIKIDHKKIKEIEMKRVQQERSAAYASEADPLAFKMLRGETTKEEWEAKIKEIKERFPYPEGI